MSQAPTSKRQKKLADAQSRNMTKGQLWRARVNQGKSVKALKGRRGILVITNRARERLGTDEAISLLDLEEDEEESDGEQGDKPEVDLQTALEQELAAARSSTTARYHIGMPCLTAISASSDPVNLVNKLFNSVLTEGKARSTHIEKLIPLQIVCQPSVEAITKAAEALIKDKLSVESESKTFAVQVKIRGSDESGPLDRSTLIKAVAELVDQTKHKVNLTEPDVVLIVEVIRSIAGVSVVNGQEFRKFKKFHLRGLTEESSTTDE